MDTRRKYHRIYFSALASIALLVGASLVVIDYIAAEEVLMTEVNNIGSRQRMLSERVAHLTLEFAVEKNEEAREQIVTLIEHALQLFDETHQLLIRGHLPNSQVVRFSDNIDDIFFGEPEILDQKARLFIYNTREVLAHEWSADFVSSYYLKQLRKATIKDLHKGLELLAVQYAKNSHYRITRLRIIVAVLLGGIILVLFSVGAFVFKPLFKQITKQERELKKLAYIDPLTNCHNRRSFLANAETEFDRSRRYSRPFSILFIDIDNFKDINDSYGHAAGDIGLVEITKVCLRNIRESDFLGRIGGDEFGVVLNECDLDDAARTAEKLRQSIAAHVIKGDFGEFSTSISIGAATINDSDNNAYDTLKRADQNLYQSKESGRDAVVAV
ncbi:MAG: diguanylate cyclase [Gammaproteobacteria bacterium]